MDTMRILHLSPHTDYLTDDGIELTKRPYPFAVDTYGAVHGRRDAIEVIGFQLNVTVQQVDVWWNDYMKDTPDSAVGRYLVTKEPDGTVCTQMCAVERVEVR